MGGGPLFAGTTVDSLFGLHGGLFGIVNTNTTVTIEGALVNNGTVSVINTGDISATDIVIGIGNVVAEIGGGIINNGNIFVEVNDPGTGNDFAAAIGIVATGVTDTIFQNATGAVLDVVAAGLDSGVPDMVLAQAAAYRNSPRASQAPLPRLTITASSACWRPRSRFSRSPARAASLRKRSGSASGNSLRRPPTRSQGC